MSLTKRTYSLPAESLQRFEKSVKPGKRSTVIAKLIEDWLEAQEREKFRKQIIKGCQEMSELYLEIEEEYHPLEEEVQRAL